MKRCYIGGSLFTDKQIKQRIYEANVVDELSNFLVYNPIENDEINDKTLKPTAKDIFEQDTEEILASDVIFADLDDNDEGLAMELGIAYMANYMRTILKELDKSDNVGLDIFNLLAEIPEKTIYATCSDIRQDGTDESGIYKSFGLNQYVIGGVEHMGKIYRSADKALDDFKSEEAL